MVWVLFDTHVSLGEFVDMSCRAILLEFDHTPPDREIAIGVIRVEDTQPYPRISGEIALLLSASGRVHEYFIPVSIYPHRRNLRCAIWHESSELGKGFPLE